MVRRTRLLFVCIHEYGVAQTLVQTIHEYGVAQTLVQDYTRVCWALTWVQNYSRVWCGTDLGTKLLTSMVWSRFG